MDTTKLPSGAVVVAYDGSPDAERGLDWGAEAATREHRPLIIVHALETARPYWAGSSGLDLATVTGSIQAAGEEVVGKALARVHESHPDLEVRTVLEAADARDLLVRLSQRAHVVVVGSHGHGPVRSLLLGSIASGVTRHAQCPVVVLRPHSETSRGGGVLVGVDATERSLPALEFAFQAASWRDAPLTVLYCFWDVDREDDNGVLVAPDDQEYVEERALLSESAAGLREKYSDVDAHLQLARGLVDRVLIDQAHGRDLLVVGSRTHGALVEALLGSVATTMVEYAPCPVAVVPHQRA